MPNANTKILSDLKSVFHENAKIEKIRKTKVLNKYNVCNKFEIHIFPVYYL